MAVLGEVSLVSSLEQDKSGLEEGGIGRRGFGKEEEEGGGGKRERDLESRERGWGRWEERGQREQGSLTGRHSR